MGGFTECHQVRRKVAKQVQSWSAWRSAAWRATMVQYNAARRGTDTMLLAATTRLQQLLDDVRAGVCHVLLRLDIVGGRRGQDARRGGPDFLV